MINALIKLIEQQQTEYYQNQNKKYLKDNSQFFTPYDIALKMIETIDTERFLNNNELRILEPSAGFGILIASLINHLLNYNNNIIKRIIIDAYEIEGEISEVLDKNLGLLKYILEQNYGILLEYNIIEENFILANKDEWLSENNSHKYDIIISNPPFSKINQDLEEAKIMEDIVYGQPNIYTLFIGMCLKLLDISGVYSVISPRNYLTGEYSKKLRNYIFNNFTLKHIHSFDKRNIFRLVNQEIIISTYINNQNQNKVKISHNGKFELQANFEDMIYNEDSLSIIIPNSNHSLSILNKFKKLKNRLTDLGIKVSVGPIVQFRNKALLSKEKYSDDFAPLLISSDIQENNNIAYYTRENHPKRKTHNKSIGINARNLLLNSNYLLLRKITARDDRNTIVTSVLEKDFLDHKLLGLDNNLLYFHRINEDETLTLEECYGLFCYINSKQFEEYYSLINGTHTINVSDFNNMGFPELETIIAMGKKLIDLNEFNKDTCSRIIDELLFD